MNFLYFGLAESLQRMFDCELFSIIEITENPKKFFQKQKIVNFKKSWFYHDNIKNINKTPDLNYLKSIENKYGINLWLIASNDRMFNHMNQDYHYSDDQILSILEQECKLYEEILDSINPDFFIIYDPPLHNSKILYELQKVICQDISLALNRREALLRLVDPSCLGEFRWIAFYLDHDKPLIKDRLSISNLFLESPKL